MARACTICNHPDREAIETAIVSIEKYREISERFSVSISAIGRHKQNCMRAAIESAQARNVTQTAEIVQEAEQQQANFVWNVLSEMKWLRTEARAVYKDARDGKDHRSSLQALGEVRQQTKLFSELLAGSEPGQAEKLEKEWIAVREAIFHALESYPEARLAVAEALFTLGRGYNDHDASGQLLEAPPSEDSS